MANELSKKRTIYIYKMFLLMQWPLVALLAVDIALCIYFSAGTSGYWGGGLAAEFMLICTAIQSIIILKTVRNFDKDELTKHKFIDTFNWQGLNLLLTAAACIAGIACSAALGAAYATDDGNSTQSADNDEHYVNINENRAAGTVLAVLSGLALLAIVRLLCLHGEVRTVLGIPEKQQAIKPASPQALPKPVVPKPAVPKPAAITSNGNNESNTREIELLTTQNNLLKDQNNLQKQQVEQLTTLTHHLQSVSGLTDGRSIAPPPDYSTLCPPLPGYAFPDGPSPGQNKQ